MARKSKAHACSSGSRCEPQNAPPHRHVNDTAFRRLEHVPQRDLSAGGGSGAASAGCSDAELDDAGSGNADAGSDGGGFALGGTACRLKQALQ